MPSRKPGIHSAFCSSVPKSRIISTVGKLPTIELSFCRSLCRPRPLVARCSRMIAISRFDGVAAAELGGEGEPQPAGGVGPAAHLAQQRPPTPARGTPPFSKSVRAHSRRWSKKRTLSSCCLERLDLALDEGVELRRASPGSRPGCRSPRVTTLREPPPAAATEQGPLSRGRAPHQNRRWSNGVPRRRRSGPGSMCSPETGCRAP